MDPNAQVRSRRRHRWGLLSGVLLVVAAASGGAVWWHKSRPYHFLVCEPGVLYRSGRLEPDVLMQVIEAHGIRTVVNLKTAFANQLPWYDAQLRATAFVGARHLDLPMEPDTPPTSEQVETWLGLFADLARNPVLVHCQHGVVRTGMLVAVYEMEFQGKSNQQALADMVSFGHDLDTPERAPVREFILDYVPRESRRTR